MVNTPPEKLPLTPAGRLEVTVAPVAPLPTAEQAQVYLVYPRELLAVMQQVFSPLAARRVYQALLIIPLLLQEDAQQLL